MKKSVKRVALGGLLALVGISLGALWQGGGFKKEDTRLMKHLGVPKRDPGNAASFQSVQGLLNIQHWISAEGVPVYFVKVPSLPIVDVRIVFDAGTTRDVPGETGVAYLTNALLMSGTEGEPPKTADQIAEHFDTLGAQVSTRAERDMAFIHLRVLSEPKTLGPAVKGIAAFLKSPAFPEKELDRERENTLNLLKRQMQSPQQVAQQAFWAHLYGQHPYAQWPWGTEQSLPQITSKEIRAFYQRYYVARNAMVVIVGDVVPSEAEAIVTTLFANMPVGEKSPSLPLAADLPHYLEKKVPFVSQQTHFLMGVVGITPEEPDRYALLVGNQILGGQALTSRLFDVIRNQAGLAYNVYSAFAPLRARGPFWIGCQTQTAQADKALDLMNKQLHRFVLEGPTDKEVEEAKHSMVGGYALRFNSNAAICEQVASMGFYGFPLDYFDRAKEAISQVTREEVLTAFQKHVHPDQCLMIQVGSTAPRT